MKDRKVIDLGRKLLALSQRGIGGERENAERMLSSFLSKHSLDLKDIEPEIRIRRIATGVNDDIRQMFINFCASIVGSDVKINKCKGRGYWSVEMNDSEWEDFTERWPTYRKILKREIIKKKREQQKELKLLVKAFISKHDMYSKDKEPNDSSLPTQEELEEIMKMLQMREKMEDINFYKKLNQ
jgi:hypothetical protein